MLTEIWVTRFQSLLGDKAVERENMIVKEGFEEDIASDAHFTDLTGWIVTMKRF